MRYHGGMKKLMIIGGGAAGPAAAVAEAGCGFVSAAEDVDALAANMAALCAASPNERAEMGRRAFAYYETHYRRRAVLDRLEEFISAR